MTDYWFLKKVIESFQKSTKFPNVVSLTVRKHPSENERKYVNFVYPGVKIQHDCGGDLVESIARHRFVVGQNSMALVIAKLCGRSSINFLVDSYSDQEIPTKYVDQTMRLQTI